MYLTRLELDTSKQKTIMALASPALFHGAVERAFADKGGKLWRLDKLAGKTYLLIVSNSCPDLHSIAEQFGARDSWESLDYAPFLNKIQNGDRRGFRLKANPVITKSIGMGRRGKVLAHVTVAQQKQWLLDRAEKYGFRLEPAEFSVVQSDWVSFRKGTEGGKKVTFRSAVFEGTLTVSDADLFRQLLQNGLGREKAYGCGMMTVTRRMV